MRIFVSYARVDKPYCLQILSTLEVHEIWYDQRLYAGQHWWKEILRRLDWCEGFIYLLSPDSVASEYCRKEFSIATNLGKNIFPVLIHDQTPIPPELRDVQYADLSKGLTPDAVKTLLNAIYLAERGGGRQQPSLPVTAISAMEVRPPVTNPQTAIAEAALALENNQFDRAVFLLKQAREKGYTSRFIDIDALLHEAEMELERQAYMREAEREYKQIASLVKRRRTQNLGCEAFQAFRRDFPEYDPDKLSAICDAYGASAVSVRQQIPQRPTFALPLLEWCEIPAGMVMYEYPNQNGTGRWTTLYVQGFQMSKYPVTNAQYQAFIEDEQGYAYVDWWNYSPHAFDWRLKNPQPKPPRFKGDDRPRENVTWYESMAFCRWLSWKTNLDICLPTEQQWQRAAQGDDHRLFPWGNNFDPTRGNTRESHLRMTTVVTRYERGVSPYGVYDMAGNVWEWCINTEQGGDAEFDTTLDAHRAVHGGSFIGVNQRAQAGFRFYLSPVYFYATIGFRLVHT
jgi:formylglycine-generating enzyme required for sulfatase activity